MLQGKTVDARCQEFPCTQQHMHALHACMCSCVRMHACAHTHACMYAHVHTHQTHSNAHARTCMHAPRALRSLRLATRSNALRASTASFVSCWGSWGYPGDNQGAAGSQHDGQVCQGDHRARGVLQHVVNSHALPHDGEPTCTFLLANVSGVKQLCYFSSMLNLLLHSYAGRSLQHARNLPIVRSITLCGCQTIWLSHNRNPSVLRLAGQPTHGHDPCQNVLPHRPSRGSGHSEG